VPADTDGDGIADADDACPTEAEVYNGLDDEDGCPDVQEVVVISCPGPSHTKEIVLFGKGTAKMESSSLPILDSVVQVLADHPEILRVQVAAYAFDAKSVKKNVALARKRAEAVVGYLEAGGVKPGILTAAGYGDACDVAEPLRRAAEFFVLLTDRGCTGVEFGCDEALALGLVPPDDLRYLEGSEECAALEKGP
jgi:outer membrane protein OmpA-like peptidoglycan-associated protein